MSIDQVEDFLGTVAFWFAVVAILAMPCVMTYWRHNEKKRAEQTEKTLQSLGFDASGVHIYDA